MHEECLIDDILTKTHKRLVEDGCEKAETNGVSKSAAKSLFLVLPDNRGAVIVNYFELKLRLPLCDIAIVILALIKLTPNVNLLVRAR
jgi:hypothetical protein